MASTITLSQANSLVRDVIELSMVQDYWVTAELASVHENRGHCYMELVEKSALGNTPVAQARACCWRGTWSRLAPRFMHHTGQPLCPGMKVLLLLHATFHEAYGFSWIVNDIDASYTMGDMARRRQEILDTLRAQGVIDMNKTLHIPQFATRVAVISSATAAGYGDFCNQLADNEYGFKFRTQLFPAVMQGEKVQQSVINALEAVNAQADNFDVVVIIRGGGSTADLSGFDTLALAENVANFPLPVITGIGHERDKSVLDVIACVSQKTPTAVAAFLISHLAGTLERIDDCAERITDSVVQCMRREQMRLQRLEQMISAVVTLRRTREENRLAQCAERMRYVIANRLLTERNRLEHVQQRLPWLVTARMERERHRLDMVEQRSQAVDPVNILRRGYSVALRDGVAVTDGDMLQVGDRLSLILASGCVEVKVTRKMPANSDGSPA